MNFDFKADYDGINQHFPTHQARPLIGITGNFGDKGCELAEGYYKSIEMAGGVPIVLPPTDNEGVILNYLDRIDGLVLSGGADINPLFLGEDPVPALHGVCPKRDRFELLLTRFAYDRQLPILGICRGIQTLVAALGGTLMQDIATELPEVQLVKHSQDMPRGIASHRVVADEFSIIGNLLGSQFAVNSFHHQAVKSAGDKLRVVARSTDGVIEAVESTEKKSIIGVQWHPECFILEHDKCMMPLFRWIVEECDNYRHAAEFHAQNLTLDSHVDTPMFFDEGVHFDQRDPKVLVDMHKLTEGRMDAVIMAAYIKQEGRDDAGLFAAGRKTDRLLGEIREMVENTKGVFIALTPKDLFRNKNNGKKSVMLGIENGYAIGKDLSAIERYRREGVVYMTLCHNGDNDICDSAMRSTQEWGGLSPFGRNVVEEMNRVGMVVDLSHAAESTFYDVLEVSKAPVICSHSSCRACCNHPRNLTDEQLVALAEHGGVAQITFYPGFLREDGNASIDDIMRHLLHAIDVAGIDHVGLGSDFDGDGGVRGCASEAEMINLTRRMLAEGLHPGQIKKIWGGNIVRVISQVQYQGYVKF